MDVCFRLYTLHFSTVDCTWDTWSDWATCSASCNAGTQGRERTMNLELHGGIPCEGPTEEVQDCFLVDCPSMYTDFKSLSLCYVVFFCKYFDRCIAFLD